MPDGRIAYVDFGNVAELSQTNKQTLIDAIVHAVNEDYEGMAEDFIKLVSLLPCSLEMQGLVVLDTPLPVAAVYVLTVWQVCGCVSVCLCEWLRECLCKCLSF